MSRLGRCGAPWCIEIKSRGGQEGYFSSLLCMIEYLYLSSYQLMDVNHSSVRCYIFLSGGLSPYQAVTLW